MAITLFNTTRRSITKRIHTRPPHMHAENQFESDKILFRYKKTHRRNNDVNTHVMIGATKSNPMERRVEKQKI